MEIFVNNKKAEVYLHGQFSGEEIKQHIANKLGLISEEYYLISNRRRVEDSIVITNGRLDIIPRILGGKGGFGSMLRAIGAQIEKTTNREACRDLSGRRLRDINEEQRLKNWINQQAEREKEAKEKRKKKLERLCEKPRHEFKDEEYDKERSALPENIEDAVVQGLQASCSTKRKTTDSKAVVKKKKPKLWVDDEFDDLSSSEGEHEESDSEGKTSTEIARKSKLEHSVKSTDSSLINLEDSVKEATEENLKPQIEENSTEQEEKVKADNEMCKTAEHEIVQKIS